ncbi:hypothetical protein DDV23_07835 [Streptococcus chenjunshii]|nr:hypothetical protein DDV22_08195 [Streptococcus chenjunshii]RFU52774.1 hypothetical protein DDV23_07835 [Streptococcus chenjunshii]
MTAIFFTRILGRVQFQQDTKGVQAHSKNKSLTVESLKTQGRAVFFAKRLARVHFLQKPVFTKNKNAQQDNLTTRCYDQTKTQAHRYRLEKYSKSRIYAAT